MNVLVTGGAGFIGRFVTMQLIEAGHNVLVFDNLDLQAHPKRDWPQKFYDYELGEGKNLTKVRGDIREEMDFRAALVGFKPDCIIHLAAKVGVGQAEYQIQPYVETNTLGTAILLQEVKRYVEKGYMAPHIMVAGSMSEYGEGYILSKELGCRFKRKRTLEELEAKQWDFAEGPPTPTCEDDPREPAGFYAITKAQQEDLVNAFHDCRTTVMRFFNVYGPEQTIGNPYTGVAAIFTNAILAGEAPMIYEDGEQMRDFIYVSDLARAIVALVEIGAGRMEQHEVFNICTGKPTSINTLVETLADVLGMPHVKPVYPGKARLSDIRHCFGDCNKLKSRTGWEPKVPLVDGLALLAQWAEHQETIAGRQSHAWTEFSRRGKEV